VTGLGAIPAAVAIYFRFKIKDPGYDLNVKNQEEKGIHSNSKDGDGRTPLTGVAWNGLKAVVKLFFEENVDLDSKDGDGQTPLSWAAEIITMVGRRCGARAVF